MTGIFSMSLLGDWVNTIFQSIMLWLDSVVYWFAAQCYQLFMKLSMAQIFDNNFYSDFANRIYSILGVFMLFYLAYALLNALVDPDKLAKGDKSVSKLASNLVISLVILGLLPSVFEYAYRLQNYILSSNVIGSLVFGTPTIDPTEDSENSMIRYGDAISFTVLNTFLNSDNYNVRLSDDQKTWFDVKYEILHDGNYSSLPGLADPIVYGANVVGAGAGGEKTVDYKVGISTIAGIYLCYIMLSFTLDLGVRVAKLAFCQLIAPIPVIMRAMPGKKGTFDKWLKLTLTVFFEIFVRVAIMYISIYLINGLVESDIWDSFFSGGIQGMLALVIIIMGILTFARQAPKMISDVLGIDTGNMKLGIGEKLKAGGFFAAGSAVGAAITSRFNPFAIARGWNKGWKEGNFKAIGEEAALRRKTLDARLQGSTWVSRRINDVRRFFGYDTTADSLDRQYERMDYIDRNGNHMLHNGHEVTKTYLENRKHELSVQMSEIDEQARLQKERFEAHSKAQADAKTILDRGKTLVNRANSAYEADLIDSNGNVLTHGNLATLRETVNRLREQGAGQSASPAQIAAHAKMINEYEKQINSIERNLTNAIVSDAMNGTSLNTTTNAQGQIVANVDSELVSAIEKLDSSNAVITHDQSIYTDGAGIRSLESNYKDLVAQNNIRVQNIESQKISLAEENAELSRIEAENKEIQEERKQSARYRAEDANRKINGK